MKHELKIWPQFYQHVKSGNKTFEVRENDRGFQTGDTVVLREWDPEKRADTNAAKGYTENPNLEFKIGYIFVLDSSRVVFALLPIKKR